MYDSIIVGAGLIGMLSARELSQAGQRVLLLDRQQPGQESSWAGGGILSPLHPWRYPDQVTRLVIWSQSHYPELIAELLSETGIDCEWRRNGLLVLDDQERMQAESWASQYGMAMHSVDRQDLAVYEPVLAPIFESALWLPDVAQVRNPRLVKALNNSLLKQGVTIRQDVDVKQLLLSHNRITGVKSGSETWHAPQVVIAAGAWSKLLLSPLPVLAPVEPVRGQMMIFKTKADLLKRIILGPTHYLIPRQDGRILVGSTLEYVGFNKVITRQGYTSLEQAAYSMVPCLKDYAVELHWAGLRPGTSNQGIPYIGQVDGIQGLYVNTGHFRNGVVLAPASARLLADVMLKRDPIVDTGHFQIKSASVKEEMSFKNNIL